MKCDELQERWFEAYPVEGDQIIPTKVYGKKDADDAIAELKDKLWISVGIIRPEWGKIVKVNVPCMDAKIFENFTTQSTPQ